MLKPYEVTVRDGVTATFLYDDETAKRLGFIKEPGKKELVDNPTAEDDKAQGTAGSASKPSGKAEAKEAQTPLNKELTSPENKELTRQQKAAATRAAKKAEEAKNSDKD